MIIYQKNIPVVENALKRKFAVLTAACTETEKRLGCRTKTSRYDYSKVIYESDEGDSHCFPLRRGFSLIELLVVVLIIGILAAVALPKYRVAVERARVARALPVLRALVQAKERYYLANGTQTAQLDDLDVQVPYSSQEGAEMSNQIYRGTPIGTIYLSVGEGVFWNSGLVAIDYYPSYKTSSCYSINGDLGTRVCATLGIPSGHNAQNGMPKYYLNF